MHFDTHRNRQPESTVRKHEDFTNPSPGKVGIEQTLSNWAYLDLNSALAMTQEGTLAIPYI